MRYLLFVILQFVLLTLAVVLSMLSPCGARVFSSLRAFRSEKKKPKLALSVNDDDGIAFAACDRDEQGALLGGAAVQSLAGGRSPGARVLAAASRCCGVVAVLAVAGMLELLALWDVLSWWVAALLAWAWLAFAYAQFAVAERAEVRLVACGSGGCRRPPAAVRAVAAMRRYPKLRRRRDAVAVAGMLALTLITTFVGAGICIAEIPWRFSTRLTRQWETSGPCAGNPAGPCLVYLTMAGDLSRSVFVNYHTTTWQPSVVHVAAELRGGGANESTTVLGSSARLLIDEPRWVHTVLLTNLTAGSRYSFTAGQRAAPSRRFTFRTAPSATDAEVTFIDGGDVGTSATAVGLNAVAAATDPAPLFAVVGGDVACVMFGLCGNGSAQLASVDAPHPLLPCAQHLALPSGTPTTLQPAIGSGTSAEPGPLQYAETRSPA